MFPRPPYYYSVGLHTAQSVFIRNHWLCEPASCPKFSDFQNLLRRELGPVVSLSNGPASSPLGHAIKYILGYGTHEQMLRVAARRIVAFVTTVLRVIGLAVGQFVSESVRWMRDTQNGKRSISADDLAPCKPRPTLVGFADLNSIPKMFPYPSRIFPYWMPCGKYRNDFAPWIVQGYVPFVHSQVIVDCANPLRCSSSAEGSFVNTASSKTKGIYGSN